MAKVENEIEEVNSLTTFPGVDVYSALSLYLEIGIY